MAHRHCIAWTWMLLLVIGLLASPQRAFAPPDLVINRSLLKVSVEFERRWFDYRSCDYREGCLKAVGLRKLLKVDVGIANIGPHDLIIGNPSERNQRDGLFVWSPCHQHWHMKTMVTYRLL